MSKESQYEINKELVFNECHVKRRDKHNNCHHIFFRNDEKKHRLPPNFPINARQNLIPLPVPVHEELHQIIDSEPQFKDINLRVYMANMAFIGELDLIPDRLYEVDPKDMMRKMWNKE